MVIIFIVLAIVFCGFAIYLHKSADELDKQIHGGHPNAALFSSQYPLESSSKKRRSIKCVNCGREIDVESKFCPFCGSEQYTILEHHKNYYTSDEINSLSWYEYNKLMADELNENGFECYIMHSLIKKFYVSKPQLGSPTYPLIDQVTRYEQLAFLKQKGLINNGRCPNCGKEITSNDIGKYIYTDSRYKNYSYHVCKDCYKIL